MIKSALSYPGGKAKALDLILSNLPDGIEDWREPFFGGGSVTIGFLQSAKASKCKRFIVGELYKEVFHFWNETKNHPVEVVDEIKRLYATWMPTHAELWADPEFNGRKFEEDEVHKDEIAKALEEGRAFWNWASNVDFETLTPIQRAARFYLINRTSFSGTGDSGTMTAYQLMRFHIDEADSIFEVSKVLQPVEIINESFEVTMSNCDPEKTFIFLDPPYYNQSSTPMYGKNGSTHKGFDHEGLAKLCAEAKCKWLMTYDDSVAVRKLYPTSIITPFKLNYTMGNNQGEDKLAGEEVFISNYTLPMSKEADLSDF